MKTKILSLMGIIIMCTALAGCSGVSNSNVGLVGGALAGGIIGGAVTDSGVGAVVGAAAGGLIGHQIGKHYN